MHLTEEILNEVEEMASLFFPPEDIAVNLELTDDESESFLAGVMCRNSKDQLVAAYLRGWFSAEILLRKAIKQSALNGSSPSQLLLYNFQKESVR